MEKSLWKNREKKQNGRYLVLPLEKLGQIGRYDDVDFLTRVSIIKGIRLMDQIRNFF